MITPYFKRALGDIRDNRFINFVTIATIAFSVIIVSAFGLFFINASDIMNAWKKGVRIMAYVATEPSSADGTDPVDRESLKQKLANLYGVHSVSFISKETALTELKSHMERQSSLFENLEINPLPDAFEIKMISESQTWEKVEQLAIRISELKGIADVEYGQRWLGRFNNIFDLFRITGLAMGGLFILAVTFIVANTSRLVLFTRREEIEIMRLVGATDGFINTPFYVTGLIQGALGGIIGIAILLVTFWAIYSNIDVGIALGAIKFRFLPFKYCLIIIAISTLVGWIGCFLSLKQPVRR